MRETLFNQTRINFFLNIQRQSKVTHRESLPKQIFNKYKIVYILQIIPEKHVA